MRTKSKIEKKCYRSRAFFVDNMSVLRFESSQGNTCNTWNTFYP